MTTKTKDKGKDLRDETILFKVTKREKDAIEEFVKRKHEGWTVSEYIRVAVLFDMISEGDLEALSIAAGQLRGKVTEKMRALWGPEPEILKVQRQPGR